MNHGLDPPHIALILPTQHHCAHMLAAIRLRAFETRASDGRVTSWRASTVGKVEKPLFSTWPSPNYP